MPTKPPAVCPCGGLRTNGRCSRCGTARTKHKQTTKERGYGYDWQKFVARRNRDPNHVLCQDCYAKGLVRPATERHHIRKVKDAPHLRLDDDNVMDLCGECHDARTARGE